MGDMGPPHREIVLRFLAAPTEVAALGGAIHNGRLLEWIDKAAYACAVGWSSSYCVTAYVGNIRFTRPIVPGHIVEVAARLIYTGGTSMHIKCTVRSADPKTGDFIDACSGLVIFVAVDGDGKPTGVRQWQPITDEDRDEADEAVFCIDLRAQIAEEMSKQNYTQDGTAPSCVTRFLAAPTDVNWGGKTHGGTVMRWIDEAACLCGCQWSQRPCVSVYAGGVRFYRPIAIGDLVEVEARLLRTGDQTMHVSVHVRAGDPKTPHMRLTAHCLTVVTCLDDNDVATAVRPWIPESEEDKRLETHAVELMALRSQLIGAESFAM